MGQRRGEQQKSTKLEIRWPVTISNKDLWTRTNQVPAEEEMMAMDWTYTLRKPPTNITRQALTWIPQRKRKRDRPKNSRRRDLEADA
jgi:hypothetical protein